MQQKNKLEAEIINTLQKDKFLTLDDFIAFCLFSKQYGYYVKQDAIGKGADFITAPEVSQMFGEMLAIWALSNYLENKDSFKNVSILELGAGSGTLMSDVLRSFAISPDLTSKIKDVNLLDINESLMKKQKQKLADYSYNFKWQENIEDFDFNKDNSLIVFANEFFDSLATKQYKFKNGAFYQVLVKHNGKGFYLTEAENKTEIAKNLLPKQEPKEGDILEYSPKVVNSTKKLCKLLKKQGGIALIIDYGYKENTFGNSVQAIYKHKFSDFLENIGKSDITFHVNFQHIKDIAIAEGLSVSELKTQGDFLQEMGIMQRYSSLSANKTMEEKTKLAQDLHRLISSDKMGQVFKVIALRYNVNNIVGL